MTALFVSDLHLDSSRPAATDCFLNFLAGPARDVATLYILGDLFEAWIGDDAAGAHEQRVMQALASFTASGTRCCFMRGNRDFLIGKQFAKATGLTLLDDETVVELADQQVLLMHGDTLCTDDLAYQRYRRLVHNPALQATYLSLPASIRERIANYARRRSQASNAGKPDAIMDVNPMAVVGALQRHGVRWLIHGHTHRPGVHILKIDGEAARRIVLGDWYEQGSVLRWTGDLPRLEALPLT
ncbi:MAG: UDP-2,3-diacylglucosamine diphosphatase [Gammaproteobacteria bacterium]